MKKLVIGLLALASLALVRPAAAENMGADWTGAYVGISGGGAWGSSDHKDATGFVSPDYALSGGLAGVGLGYNWQTGPYVLGGETDFSYARIVGGTGLNSGCTGTCSTDVQGLGTVRLRAGYAWHRYLPYVTGGLGYGLVEGAEGPPSSPYLHGSGDTYRLGWTAGAGLEAKIWNRWSAKAEYLHVDLGDGHVFTDTANGGFTVYRQRVGVTADVVRFGINFKFF